MERRKFTREFKLEAVRLIQERGVTVAQAARDLGVHGTVLRRWVQECVADSQPRMPHRQHERFRPIRVPWKAQNRYSESLARHIRAVFIG